MADFSVVYPAGRDVESWSRDHVAGKVPSRWPYGLEGLGALAPTRWEPAHERGRARRIAAEVASWLPRGGDDPRARRARLTWDENVARNLTAKRGTSRHSGVIWLTDQAARGVDVRRRTRWLRDFASLWVLSSAQVAPLRELLGDGGAPVRYVPFGVDHEFFAERPAAQAPMVLSVGGDRDRDTETLFRALAQVAAAVPTAEIVVQTASALEPPEGVTKISHVSHAELRELYARASVVTIATRPNLHVSGMTVSLEAMSTARPVVITGTPGMGDYVVDGETGIVVEPGDAGALSAATAALLRDPARADAYGRAGRLQVVAARTTRHLCRNIADAIRPT
ncbi:glycosyltransferase family 4 protein [Cellulomonas rhizosphaerae]|uniref:D-inositol 3-phosphate glycosyltransferase n=1 Tax=Cellulomonas rhizosphaerae TaxID=2293719 RepID=A0A413RMI8_9CELL|nr:glycosyltransferase family 4 protein [Cellulomonas rhizosphaerae]RHA41944.1 glycosyltransferase [Cellulomonas rhizosphaerae]